MVISLDISRRAAAEPDRPALLGPEPVTFGALGQAMTTRAEQLAASGLEAGGRWPVVTSDPFHTLTEIVAADLVGAAAIVVDGSWPEQARATVIKTATTAASAYGDSPRLIIFTSRRRGTPKPVIRTRRSWTTSYPTFSALTGIGDEDRVLIPGPLSASPFLFGALHALTMGASVHALPRWSLEAASQACATCTAAHVIPPMLTELTERIDPDASRLRVAVCAGTAVDPPTEAAARRVGVDVIPYYGSAELGVVAIRRPDGRLRPFPGVELMFRNGIICARSDYLASALERDPDSFATTGDRGELKDDGSLVVYGPDPAR